jgi:hypothetical protein
VLDLAPLARPPPSRAVHPAPLSAWARSRYRPDRAYRGRRNNPPRGEPGDVQTARRSGRTRIARIEPRHSQAAPVTRRAEAVHESYAGGRGQGRRRPVPAQLPFRRPGDGRIPPHPSSRSAHHHRQPAAYERAARSSPYRPLDARVCPETRSASNSSRTPSCPAKNRTSSPGTRGSHSR